MNQMVPIIDTMNQAAIWRSERRSADGLLSVLRGLCSGRTGFSYPFISPSWPPGPPLCRIETIRFLVYYSLRIKTGWSLGTRREPHGDADDGCEAEEPDEEALCDRAERAELEATGRRGL